MGTGTLDLAWLVSLTHRVYRCPRYYPKLFVLAILALRACPEDISTRVASDFRSYGCLLRKRPYVVRRLLLESSPDGENNCGPEGPCHFPPSLWRDILEVGKPTPCGVPSRADGNWLGSRGEISSGQALDFRACIPPHQTGLATCLVWGYSYPQLVHRLLIIESFDACSTTSTIRIFT